MGDVLRRMMSLNHKGVAMASPLARVAIEQIELERGDTLTVFANVGTPQDRRVVLVELRVTPGGHIEVFSNVALHSRPVEEWQPMGEV